MNQNPNRPQSPINSERDSSSESAENSTQLLHTSHHPSPSPTNHWNDPPNAWSDANDWPSDLESEGSNPEGFIGFLDLGFRRPARHPRVNSYHSSFEEESDYTHRSHYPSTPHSSASSIIFDPVIRLGGRALARAIDNPSRPPSPPRIPLPDPTPETLARFNNGYPPVSHFIGNFYRRLASPAPPVLTTDCSASETSIHSDSLPASNL
ncbi:hypothetical protein SCHPADRAFT_947648 [Schizopora paradoxa]|uniref:Uncharacterized protein n=1 Tax=Schizopora paradoxa TaxID=27342 RepID=A0A0H2QY72_9AGAM|nr:hypothetical protein SCHPADRAFT_947648 [Schizopora paradoxa]